MGLYREQGVVLRSYKLGETDRILHVLTPTRGKVRCVAKGVRKPGSRFGGRLEPFSHVDVQLYEGRNLDIVTQAELLTPFAEIRDDWTLSACASTMAEGADRVAQEHERANRLFLLVLDGLRALRRHPDHAALLLDAYLFRLASVAGYHPYLRACAGCGSSSPAAAFSLDAGGVLCTGCAPVGSQPVDPAVLRLLDALLHADWGDLPEAVGTSGRVRRAGAALVNSYLTYHLGRPLVSWDLVPR